ncbi:MAG: winged helix-turn-helix transcriptional regulator [Ktedonobacterales bacterium]|nr:winged helix-turn-helix transcriptional regulator [Ktedonobacterales bacterium]
MTPIYEPAVPQEALLDAQEMTMRGDDGGATHRRPITKMLRFSGFTLDPLSGSIHWRGEAVALATEERELLGVLLRRAGQIVSREHLAALVGASADVIDRRVARLTRALETAGIHCRPRVAAGLGYILWR